MTDSKYTANPQVEHLHARYMGTGHADTTKHEWLTNLHRDTATSIIGHPPLLYYNALALGESVARVRMEMIEKMVQPSGPPPKES